MAKTKKVTITVPIDVAETLDSWAKAGAIESVSKYIAESVKLRMNREQSLAKLEEVFGRKPPADMIARAQRNLGFAGSEPPHSARPASDPAA